MSLMFYQSRCRWSFDSPPSAFSPRIQRRVSMETGTRQRSVSQPKVHPVREGRGTEIFQQAGRKLGFHCVFTDQLSLCEDACTVCWCTIFTPASVHRPGIPRPWWKLRPWTPPFSRPRSETPAACRSPTWKTTAHGTSLSTTVMLRYCRTLTDTPFSAEWDIRYFSYIVAHQAATLFFRNLFPVSTNIIGLTALSDCGGF